MFADYKGQRKPTPSELSEQFPLARRLLEAMNITVLELMVTRLMILSVLLPYMRRRTQKLLS